MFARWLPSNRSVWGILALALVLRAGFLWRYAPMLDEDRDLYRQIAEQVVAGKGYSRPLQWKRLLRLGTFGEPDHLALTAQGSGPVVFWLKHHDAEIPPDLETDVPLDFPTAYRPPLYPLLIAGTIALLQTHRAIAIIHLLLGVATAGLTMQAARRMSLSSVAVCAGALVALDPLLLYHTPQVMTETLAAFLTAALLAVAALPATWRRHVSVGVLLGLAGLCRPTYFAVAALWLVCELLPRTGSNLRARVLGCVWIGMAALLVVLPWGIRNRIVMGHWIVSTTHGGYTLLLGHNWLYTRAVVEDEWEAGWQTYNMNVGYLPVLFPTELTWRSVPDFEVAVDRQYVDYSWSYMRENPGTALRSGLSLWRRMWSIVPMQSDSMSPTIRTGIGLFYGITFALAFLGLLSLFRTGWSMWLPVLALLAGFTAVHFVYWADMRMRTPLAPAIALLAAQGASRFVRGRRASG